MICPPSNKQYIRMMSNFQILLFPGSLLRLICKKIGRGESCEVERLSNKPVMPKKILVGFSRKSRLCVVYSS